MHPDYADNQGLESGHDIAFALVETDEEEDLPYEAKSYPEPRAFTADELLETQWRKVRHIPESMNCWDPSKDKLTGKE